MSRDAAGGPSWLDSLALWAARGEVAPPSVPAAVRPTGGAQGISRRTVLGTAAAAALLSSPLRFLIPTPARAATTTIAVCISNNGSLALAVFQECVRQPASAFELYGQAIKNATDELRTATSPAKRRRLLGIIDRSTLGQDRALRKIEDCNAKLWEDSLGGAANCRSGKFPSSGGGGGGLPPPPPKCTPEAEIQCGDICCNATGSPECCLCPKTAMYQCCANGSKCTCCG